MYLFFLSKNAYFSMDKSKCINKTETRKAAIVERWPLKKGGL